MLNHLTNSQIQLARKITLSFSLLLVLVNFSFGQSAYFFKTTEALELEKWDAVESSNSTVSNAIAEELNSRAKANEEIAQLEAELNEKLKVEDYFGAETIQNQIEMLKAVVVESSELRKKIELSVGKEDYETAAQYKSSLLNLHKPESTAQINASTTGVSSGTSNNPTSVVSAGSGSLQDAFTSTNQSNSTGSGLFSSSSGKTDKFGRTEAENRSLARKKLVNGGVFMGSGLVLGITGAAIFAAFNGDDAFMAVGAILVLGGGAMLITGAAVMGTSVKYKKRANQLANGTVSISPSILNIHSYSGASVNSHAGYGLTFNYQF